MMYYSLRIKSYKSSIEGHKYGTIYDASGRAVHHLEHELSADQALLLTKQGGGDFIYREGYLTEQFFTERDVLVEALIWFVDNGADGDTLDIPPIEHATKKGRANLPWEDAAGVLDYLINGKYRLIY